MLTLLIAGLFRVFPYPFPDMGCGEEDDSLFLVEDIQPHSFDTTDLIQEMLEDIDFVLHIGDISYARGFSAVVSIVPSCNIYQHHHAVFVWIGPGPHAELSKAFGHI